MLWLIIMFLNDNRAKVSPSLLTPYPWEYLLKLLEHTGFPTRWRIWLALLLSSFSSAVRLNGVQGQCIKHQRGSGRVSTYPLCSSSLSLAHSNTFSSTMRDRRGSALSNQGSSHPPRSTLPHPVPPSKAR
jgi:hypothetical protein